MNSTQLSSKDRKILISSLIGEYQYLCHDDPDDDDMTPAQHYSLLNTYSDEELIADSDLFDSAFTSVEDYYDFYSSYIPEEYQVN